MSQRDWQDMASVYQAGADQQRGYIMNIERQQQAQSLDAMAARCEELAAERNMTFEQLEEMRYARRQRKVPAGSRVRCNQFMHGRDGKMGLCCLHRDHVQDGTDHELERDREVPGPLYPEED
jgi:hypothetical protein